MPRLADAPFQVCMEKYKRSVPWAPHDVTFACQLPKGHEDGHSWEALRQSDRVAMEPPVEVAASGTEISVLIIDIDEGKYDPYLENILAVAHERKRELRSKRTFPSVRSRQDTGDC